MSASSHSVTPRDGCSSSTLSSSLSSSTPVSSNASSSSTVCVGAIIVISRSAPLTEAHLSFTCGLAFGVMMFVSLFDMLFPAMADPLIGSIKALAIFAFGFVVLIGILKLVPSEALMAMHDWLEKKEENRNKSKYGDAEQDNEHEEKDVLTNLLSVPNASGRRTGGDLRTRTSGSFLAENISKDTNGLINGGGLNNSSNGIGSGNMNGSASMHAAKNSDVMLEVDSTPENSPALSFTAATSSVPPLSAASVAASSTSSFSVVSPSRVLRFGILTAVILGIHNLPEGLAVFISSISSLHEGLIMAFAISLHNIPEGLVVATPIYAATHSRSAALLWTMLSGVTEPLGALLAVTALKDYLTVSGIRNALSFVGGIMSAVSITELLPEAKRYGKDDDMYKGIASGVAIMAFTWIIMD